MTLLCIPLACTGCWTARGHSQATPFPEGLSRRPEFESAANPSSIATSSSNVASVLSEVQQLGTIDPAAQQALLADMQKTDPTMWPQLVQVARSSVAYRQQHQKPVGIIDEQVPTTDSSFAGPAISPYQQVSFNAATQAARSDLPNGNRGIDPAQPAIPSGAAVPLPQFDVGPIGAATPPPELAAAYPDTKLPPAEIASNATPKGAISPGGVPTVRGDKWSDDWRDHIAMAIRLLDDDQSGSDQPQSVTNQARQRLLQLVANRPDEAFKPISGVAAQEQRFWSEELFGLAKLLDEETEQQSDRRIAKAVGHLRTAADALGATAKLEVRNLAFCTEVSSFGVYKPFAAYEFVPGQETLLYAELENFASDATEQGYHTSLRSSYGIFDEHGARLEEHDFAITEEYCRNPRRDFFIRYFVYLPKEIGPGSYTLQLTIEDLKSEKVGRATIPFQIRDQ